MGDASGQEFGQPQEMPKFELPPIGTHVRVERSSGDIQLGWKVISENPIDKKIRVERELPGQAEIPAEQRRIEYKNVSREKFIAINPVPGIDDVNSWEDLETALKRVSFVPGSEQSFASKDLINMISQVREGRMPIDAVTRSGGLRDKFRQLSGIST